MLNGKTATEPPEDEGFSAIVRERVRSAIADADNLPETADKRAAELADLAVARDACWGAAERLGLVLVGGEAIDAVLPRGGVYMGAEHRDIDFLTEKSPKLVAAILVGALRDRGVAANMQPALHDGTWTIKSHRCVVADVTGVSPLEIERLRGAGADQGTSGGNDRRRKRGGRKSGPPGAARRPGGGRVGMAVAPVQYLKMSLHFELSRPAAHCRRWPRLHSRMRALYDAFPPGGGQAPPRGEAAGPPGGLELAAMRLCESNRGRALLCGTAAAREMLGTGGVAAEEDRVDVIVQTDDETDALCFAISMARAAEAPGRPLLTDGPFGGGLFLPGYSCVTDDTGGERARVYCSSSPLAAAECGWLASADVVLFLMLGEILASGDSGGGLRRAADSLAVEMLSREDEGCCSGNWSRMSLHSGALSKKRPLNF